MRRNLSVHEQTLDDLKSAIDRDDLASAKIYVGHLLVTFNYINVALHVEMWRAANSQLHAPSTLFDEVACSVLDYIFKQQRDAVRSDIYKRIKERRRK